MAIRYIMVLILLLCMQSCVHGVLYTHKTSPLSINYQNTNTDLRLHQASGSTKHVDVQVQAKWDSNGIGEIAKKNGISTIYYADLETVSVLFGIWEQKSVHIYGQ